MKITVSITERDVSMKAIQKIFACVIASGMMISCSTAITANAAMTACHSARRESQYQGGVLMYRGVGEANGTSCYVFSGFMYTTYGTSPAYGNSQYMATNWISSDYTGGHGEFSFLHYGQSVSVSF
jgi:hypothetical protein